MRFKPVISNCLAWCGWVDLLQTQPYDPHGRGTSIHPQNETELRAALLIRLLISFSGFPLLLLTYVRNSFLREFVETICSNFVTSLRPSIYMARVGTIPVDFSILDLNKEQIC